MIMAAVLLCSGVAKSQSMAEWDPVPMPLVSEDSVMKHVTELSSEVYEGRLAGSEGYYKAVKYVKQVLGRYGVKELEEQTFEVECNEVENCKFNVYNPIDATKNAESGSGGNEKRVFTLGNEFCCAGMTGRGYVDAQMVFCGYGLDHGSFNEYRNVDVKGKIVVVLSGLPDNDFLQEAAKSGATLLRDKARTAERHGAIGMLVVNRSKSCLADAPQARVYCGELPHLATFPILQLTLNCGREILWGETMDLDTAIARIDRLHKPQSFALLKKAEIDVNARYRAHSNTCNVIGLLEGSDPKLKKEYIMVGASLDGAGMQGETCIFPGADINASGVAALLETARVLSDPDARPKRSILFVFFSASEQQYLGSRVFADNYKRLRRVEAFVNVQNIGYGDSLVVMGDNRYPTLWGNALHCDTTVRAFHCTSTELQRIWPLAVMKGDEKADSVAIVNDYRFAELKKINNHCFHADGRHNMIASGEKSNPRGDARIFDAMGVPSLVITTHNGMQNNHVTTDIWENIDRRIITLATQLTSDLAAQLGEGIYQGRGVKR